MQASRRGGVVGRGFDPRIISLLRMAPPHVARHHSRAISVKLLVTENDGATFRESLTALDLMPQ